MWPGSGDVVFHFEGFCLDLERRELRRHSELIPVEPQVFDVLAHLVANREQVVSKDQLLVAVWGGRVVSESARGLGQENPAFRQLFTSQFIPDGTAEQMRWFNDLQRLTTSPQNAARIRNASDEMDVSALLDRVRVPTLMLHCRDDAVQPFEEGRRLAAGIAGSRFVALEGRNHLTLESEPAWNRFLDEVYRFLATPAGR